MLEMLSMLCGSSCQGEGWHTWHRAIKVKVVGCCPTRKNDNSSIPKIRKPTLKQFKKKERQVFFAPNGEYEETAESGGNMLPPIHGFIEVQEGVFVHPRVKIPFHYAPHCRWADISMDPAGCHPHYLCG